MAGEFTPMHEGGAGPPLVCLHGFTDTWRTWELVLPRLEQAHRVLAPTLLGHAGGPPLTEPFREELVVDAAEQAMDGAGIDAADLVGNSLGGYVALQLAARGRARSVVALAPAGGWLADDPSQRQTLRFFRMVQDLVKQAAPHADAIMATPEGRRRATEYITTSYEHIPAELLAHQLVGAARCEAALPFIEQGERGQWSLATQRIECPVRIMWGTADRILPWPASAERFRREWLPGADWVELEGVGHRPQLDVPAETAALILEFTAHAGREPAPAD